MKNTEQAKSFFNAVQNTTGNAKPVAPFATQQMFNGRHRPDPSSVVRSDRYPLPDFAEYRTRAND